MRERRVFRGGSFLPFCFPVVPVIDHSGVPRMQARLIEKRIEPATFPGVGELVVLNPFDHPVEPAVRLFFEVRGAHGSTHF